MWFGVFVCCLCVLSVRADVAWCCFVFGVVCSLCLLRLLLHAVVCCPSLLWFDAFAVVACCGCCIVSCSSFGVAAVGFVLCRLLLFVVKVCCSCRVLLFVMVRYWLSLVDSCFFIVFVVAVRRYVFFVI